MFAFESCFGKCAYAHFVNSNICADSRGIVVDAREAHFKCRNLRWNSRIRKSNGKSSLYKLEKWWRTIWFNQKLIWRMQIFTHFLENAFTCGPITSSFRGNITVCLHWNDDDAIRQKQMISSNEQSDIFSLEKMLFVKIAFETSKHRTKRQM